jgi:hypothetical protein
MPPWRKTFFRFRKDRQAGKEEAKKIQGEIMILTENAADIIYVI